MLADAQTDFVRGISGEHLNIGHACLAERFLLHGVADRCGALIVASTLEFDRNDRPPGLIDDENVYSTILYEEESLKGKAVVMENIYSEDSKINLEHLFSAVTEKSWEVKEIFNQ